MKPTIYSASRMVRGALALAGLMLTALALPAADFKYEAQLIWATNDQKSPDPKHKPVEAEVRKKLADLPLKWQNYFEVNRKTIELSRGGTQKVALSDKCVIEVKDVGGRKVEVSLLGKGEPVLKRTQPLPKREILVLGGNAPNATAWLVTLKRVE
jgi:hypothetical protein